MVKGRACGLCHHQRKRCPQDCPFRPYFPVDQPELYRNAIRLFGVANLKKLMAKVQPEQYEDTMTSIIYEVNRHAEDSVYGCYGALIKLQQQVARAEQELKAINSWIASFRRLSEQPDDHDHRCHPLSLPSNFWVEYTHGHDTVIQSDAAASLEIMKSSMVNQQSRNQDRESSVVNEQPHRCNLEASMVNERTHRSNLDPVIDEWPRYTERNLGNQNPLIQSDQRYAVAQQLPRALEKEIANHEDEPSRPLMETTHSDINGN
ncbi:hypothetical protein CDL15_Pgr025632 [Punica granatum]|nr:hypothetical protein CDL15_Pgr025632 [Punica granatum]